MIPQIDLTAQYMQLKSEIDEALMRVAQTGRYVLGPEVEAFEDEFARVCDSSYAVCVNSGTSALYLSLVAAGVGPGDEVITVPFTFEATVSAITATGASVRFVDIDERSLTMDGDAIERQITDRTKAVIPVHLFGQPADMNPILDVARRHRLRVIADACQAHGATYDGRSVGSLGDVACFSFYPSKNLATFGEGGAVVTSNAALADAVRKLRSWGPAERSGNYRMSAIEAAVLRVKLPRLRTWTARRQAIATRYADLLADSDIQLPAVMPYAGHVFHVYAVRSTHRDGLARALHARGVEIAVHYRQPVHLQDKYKDLGYSTGAFPVAEQTAREELSLPLYPELSDESIEKVADAVRESLPVERAL
jgi:dTDP-4-amino-4,6-dideoxygalactose transaminase